MNTVSRADQRRARLNLLAVYSLLFINNTGMLMSPSMDTLVNAFPFEPYSKVLLISTLPSLVALPFILLSGNMVGTRIRYRTMALIAVPVFIVSGTLPFFLHSLDVILACRAVYGVCYGLIGPLSNALILRSYEGENRVRYLGYGNIVIGLGGVVFQMTAGWLCMVGWNYLFLGHLLGVIPLLLIASLVFSVLSSFGQNRPSEFLWCLSAILTAADCFRPDRAEAGVVCNSDACGREVHVSASCYSKGSSAAVSAGLRTVYLHPDKIDDHFLYREDGRDGRRYDQRYDPIDGNVWGSVRRTRFADVLPSCEAIPHARLGVGPLPDDRDEFDEFGAVDRCGILRGNDGVYDEFEFDDAACLTPVSAGGGKSCRQFNPVCR